MKPGSPVRVGLIGAGAIAQVSHLPALSRIRGVRIAALCDVDHAKARRVADRYNIPRVTESYTELVSLDAVDAVDICLPNHLHAHAAITALQAGKDVLCERPFSRSSKEAGQMVAAAKEGGRVLMSGFNNRFREDAMVLKRFVNEGEVGNVFFTKAGWLMQPSTWSGAGWRKKKQYAGGGVLIDLGVQMLDTAMWILDMPTVTAVSASTHPRSREEEMESTAAAYLRLESGGTITVEVSWGLLMERDHAYLELFGEKGAALLNPLRLHKEMHGSLVEVTPSLESPRNAYKKSYENEIRHFVECVSNREKPAASGEDAMTILRLLEALYESAAEGREVRLD